MNLWNRLKISKAKDMHNQRMHMETTKQHRYQCKDLISDRNNILIAIRVLDILQLLSKQSKKILEKDLQQRRQDNARLILEV